MSRELDLTEGGTKDYAVAADELFNAIFLASDQDQRTWVISGGKRIACIVTVEDGERLDQLDAVVTHPASREPTGLEFIGLSAEERRAAIERRDEAYKQAVRKE